ncbi:MAG: hypothetical protein NVS3B20_06480 [Polyangiales bacterium]
MQFLVLISILVATIAIPVSASKARSPRLGLRKAVLYAFVFEVCYLVLCRLVYPRLG